MSNRYDVAEAVIKDFYSQAQTQNPNQIEKLLGKFTDELLFE